MKTLQIETTIKKHGFYLLDVCFDKNETNYFVQIIFLNVSLTVRTIPELEDNQSGYSYLRQKKVDGDLIIEKSYDKENWFRI